MVPSSVVEWGGCIIDFESGLIDVGSIVVVDLICEVIENVLIGCYENIVEEDF